MSEPKKAPGSAQVLAFMVVLCFTCALILSSLASALREPQEKAEELNRSREMLLAAKLYHPNGYFLVKNEQGEFVPARYAGEGKLEPGQVTDIATGDEIFEISKLRVSSFLVDAQGRRSNFAEQGIDQGEYIADNKKSGYNKLDWKLVYEVSPNGVDASTMHANNIRPDSYILTVNGFGLWDAIYGYLALEPDGNTVRGIAWYEHAETPGLGANISHPSWQSQFPGKVLFENGSGSRDVAPLGLTVVRGKVSEVMGNSRKTASAVDGMPGATLTGDGVTKAYKESLAPLRPFLVGLGTGMISNRN